MPYSRGFINWKFRYFRNYAEFFVLLQHHFQTLRLKVPARYHKKRNETCRNIDSLVGNVYIPNSAPIRVLPYLPKVVDHRLELAADVALCRPVVTCVDHGSGIELFKHLINFIDVGELPPLPEKAGEHRVIPLDGCLRERLAGNGKYRDNPVA